MVRHSVVKKGRKWKESHAIKEQHGSLKCNECRKRVPWSTAPQWQPGQPDFNTGSVSPHWIWNKFLQEHLKIGLRGLGILC